MYAQQAGYSRMLHSQASLPAWRTCSCTAACAPLRGSDDGVECQNVGSSVGTWHSSCTTACAPSAQLSKVKNCSANGVVAVIMPSVPLAANPAFRMLKQSRIYARLAHQLGSMLHLGR